MVSDLLNSSPDPTWNANVCIVGAGAAGIVLAIELAERGKRVLLLEGGGAFLEEAAQEPYRSTVEGRSHRGIHEGRFRAYGGTTTKWGGQILELDESDFEERPWIEGSGWPFPKATLRPFYCRALKMEALDGAIAEDAAVWEEIQEKEPVLPGVLSYLSRWCPEPNLARLHRKTLSESHSIQIWLHANAVGLDMEDERIVGVRTRTQAGKETTFTAIEYVFCVGAIESSRFFLQPRSGGLPWNRSGLLGRNFQDHIDCDVAHVSAHHREPLHTIFDSIFIHGYKYQPKLKLPAESQRTGKVLSVGATLSYSGEHAEALAQARTAARHISRGHWNQVQSKDIAFALRNLPNLIRQTHRYVRAHRSYQPASARVSLRVHCEQEPCSKSRITLDDSRDSLGLLRTKLTWQVSALELRSIRAMTLAVQKSLSGIADLKPCAGFAEDTALSARCEDSFHHMGGMRMDSSPLRGVVDTDLRLHGTRNTWVCSTAVFPTSGFSNPTHTLIALALRLAEHLSR